MRLSVNYSLELADLLRAGDVQVDRIKCADWPDMIAAARELRPVYVHFPFDAGTTSGRRGDFAAADAMARDTDTPYVNLHLVSYRRDFSDDDTTGVINQMLADINAAATAVGRDRVILENIPYFAGAATPDTDYHPASVDAAVITRVVRDSGCGFLLDTSHARIAAHYLGVDPHAYSEQLPLDRLAELHVTGVGQHNGRLADHMDFRDDDWRWVEHAIRKIHAGNWATPWTVALEYGGIGEAFRWRSEKSVLAEQVPRLYEMVRR
jgi:uncharacterized protein (UPF0276 family)